MNLDDALQTFIVESRELLQDMEDALLRMENEPADPDTVNAIFRAAHTIKGSSGLFGLDDVVAFTHVVEGVLDKVRDQELEITGDLVALLLTCSDHIGALVDEVAAGAERCSPEKLAISEQLMAQLNVFLGAGHGSQSSAVSLSQPVDHVEIASGRVVDTDNWHISLRFGPDVLRNGMDPLSFLRYLGTLGEIVGITTLFDALPVAAELDPESCYLGFEINLKSNADKAAIESAFEFVRDDAVIHILPPHTRISEYINLIRDLPEDDMLLGQILVQCGTLTQNELQQALQEQEAAEDAPRHIGEILLETGVVQPEVVEAALEKQQQTKEAKSRQQQMIRVDAEKLDHLINLIGELVIAGAGANMVAGRTGMPDMLEATSTMLRLVEEVRDSALTLRMVQIGDTFNRFQRVVRDVSRELGKDIALVIRGADTELDKTVVEKIGDPLMHLVRNAMDHGIETAEVRVANGKSAQGTLNLNAYHESGGIVIEVSDDGGGLKRERILAKAIEKGIVSASQQLSDQDVFKLIFEPGFSTAEQVTNLSGRGVGMDVVRRNIEALRGTIEIDSTPGNGTTMRIRLPLTLAIIDGFLVGVNKASFVVPLDMVIECIEMSEQDRQAMSERNYVNLRGEVLPFVNLREHFSIEGEASRRINIVVVQYAGQKAGLVVDALLGEFQTVIKPLGRIFEHLQGIGGSTILGSGEVALILDVPSLIQQAVSLETQQVVFA